MGDEPGFLAYLNIAQGTQSSLLSDHFKDFLDKELAIHSNHYNGGPVPNEVLADITTRYIEDQTELCKEFESLEVQIKIAELAVAEADNERARHEGDADGMQQASTALSLAQLQLARTRLQMAKKGIVLKRDSFRLSTEAIQPPRARRDECTAELAVVLRANEGRRGDNPVDMQVLLNLKILASQARLLFAQVDEPHSKIELELRIQEFQIAKREKAVSDAALGIPVQEFEGEDVVILPVEDAETGLLNAQLNLARAKVHILRARIELSEATAAVVEVSEEGTNQEQEHQGVPGDHPGPHHRVEDTAGSAQDQREQEHNAWMGFKRLFKRPQPPPDLEAGNVGAILQEVKGLLSKEESSSILEIKLLFESDATGPRQIQRPYLWAKGWGKS